MATSSARPGDGISRSRRGNPPAHFLFTIESYPLLRNDNAVKKYESNAFKASGKDWKLILYPSGKDSRSDGEGHVSLYLAIANTNNLSNGWEVNVCFKLFVYNQITDKFLTIQDGDRFLPVRRFHALKTEWGFDQLISWTDFSGPSNGYLVDDKCVFGAEVFVHNAPPPPPLRNRSPPKHETLSFVNCPPAPFTWNLENFSRLDENGSFSEPFTVDERVWKLRACLSPRRLSLFLHLTNCEMIPSNKPVYASYKLKILNHDGQNKEETGNHWFDCQKNEAECTLIPLSELNDTLKPENRFINGDAITLVVEILQISKVTFR